MERERICTMGVPGAWGLSPKAPLDEYVTNNCTFFNISCLQVLFAAEVHLITLGAYN
jgi:hypothetical protein